MRAAKVQASLRIRAFSPEPPLLAHTSNESRGTFRQKARSLAPLNGWACAVKICHDGMLKDTNLLDAAQISILLHCITNGCKIFQRTMGAVKVSLFFFFLFFFFNVTYLSVHILMLMKNENISGYRILIG